MRKWLINTAILYITLKKIRLSRILWIIRGKYFANIYILRILDIGTLPQEDSTPIEVKREESHVSRYECCIFLTCHHALCLHIKCVVDCAI